MLTAIQPSVFASEIFSCHFLKIIMYGSILVCEAIETHFQTFWYMFLLLKCTWHTTLYEFQEHNSVINNRMLCDAQHGYSYHLSPSVLMTVPLTSFSVLYFSVCDKTGSLYLPLPSPLASTSLFFSFMDLILFVHFFCFLSFHILVKSCGISLSLLSYFT